MDWLKLNVIEQKDTIVSRTTNTDRIENYFNCSRQNGGSLDTPTAQHSKQMMQECPYVLSQLDQAREIMIMLQNIWKDKELLIICKRNYNYITSI